MGLSPAEILVATLIVALGAMVQGSVGFGIALIAAPVLVLLDPRFVPGPLLLAGLPFMLLLAWRERHGVEFQSMGVPVTGQLLGIGVALVLLAFSEAKALSLIVAVVVLLGVGLSVSGLKPELSKRNFLLGGILAGFMGTTSSMPGPALALIHQHVSAARMRATLAPFFCVGGLVGLTGLIATGQMGRPEFAMGLWLVPAGLAGLAISSWTAPRMRESLVRPAVLVFSSVAALMLLYRSV
jgi:uncharacterized membrane protein YfcA